MMLGACGIALIISPGYACRSAKFEAIAASGSARSPITVPTAALPCCRSEFHRGCSILADAEHGGILSAMARVFCDVRDAQSMLGLISAS
jgi:hypothetical protein